MRVIRFAAALSLCWLAASAAYGAACAPTQFQVALPQIAFGLSGTWSTKIVVTNVTSNAQNLTICYFDPSGNALLVPFSGVPASTQSLTVPANGQLEVVPDSNGTNLVVGWAGLSFTNLSLRIQGVFTFTNQGSTTQAVAPIVSQSGVPCIIPLPVNTVYTMPFDQTGGSNSGFAFANTMATPVTMTLTFYDQSGNVITQYTPPQVSGFGHTQFDLISVGSQAPALAAAVAGKKGTMQITGTGVVPLGFKFFGTSGFTTWLP
jgi:hypothetical protein